MGGTPLPPFTDKIRKVVFEVPPKSADQLFDRFDLDPCDLNLNENMFVL